jgi:hypothetical protein
LLASEKGEKIMAPRHKRLHSGVLSGQPYVVQFSYDTAGDPSPQQCPAHVLTPPSWQVSDPAAEIAAKRGYHESKAAKDAAYRSTFLSTQIPIVGRSER